MAIINLGILAHVDAGKTTTVERLLHLSGAIQAAGSVDSGSTQTDHLAVERQRGISVRAAEAVLNHRGVQVNIIDTPGHMDFTAEVERSLSAVDCAVVIVSAVEGVQSQTELFWKSLRAANMPALVYINKIDRQGADPHGLLDSLRQQFSPDLVALSTAQSPGSRDCSVAPRALDEDDLMTLCSYDSGLEQAFLAGEAIDQAALLAALGRQSKAGRVYPVLMGASALDVGTAALLDAVVDLLPQSEPLPDAPLSGRVYTISHDPQLGKVAHVRLYGGSLRNRDSVVLRRPGAEPLSEKITQIRRMQGGRQVDTGVLLGGDIGALLGLREARTGDIIGEQALRQMERMAVPLFSVKVEGGGDNPAPLLKAVGELSDADPLLDFEWVPETREIHIRVMGSIQLEVLAFMLKDRYGLEVTFSPPTVIYKETPAKPGRGYEAYTMPKPCWAVIELHIEPMPRGSGFVFESVARDDDIFYKYQEHIRLSMPESLRQGPLGWEVTDLKITLTGGSHHTVHTHPMDFFLATPMAVMNGLENCGSQLLEPMQRLRLSAPEDFSGKLIGDIVGMGGEMESPVVRDGQIHMEALVPVARSLDYGVRLAAQTSGKGRFAAEFHGYRECPRDRLVTAPRRGVDPRDRAKWILHKRSAL